MNRIRNLYIRITRYIDAWDIAAAATVNLDYEYQALCEQESLS